MYGYCCLNDYRYKLNQFESSECVCGDIETVQHFILECPLYEDNRQKLQKNLFLQLGIPYLDMDLLLGNSENENLSSWRESVVCELGQYLPILVVFSAELLMGMHNNNLLTVSNTKSLKLHLWKFYL